MESIGLFLKTRSEIVAWHKERQPASIPAYEEMLKSIRAAAFLGAGNLLRKERDESGDNFLTALAELNLAKKLLESGVKNLKYEKERKVDFACDSLAISVKSLNVKEYEKKIQEISSRLREKGGGRESFSYKGGSNITITVQPTAMGTFSEEIFETGAVQYLDTDYAHLQGLLRSIAEFETVPAEEYRKKVLFVMNYSESFAEYYAADLAAWYFGVPQERPILVDHSIYLKYLGKEKKENNIDAIVFVMYWPIPLLVWPDDCLKDRNEKKTRTLIFTPDSDLKEQLERILFMRPTKEK